MAGMKVFIALVIISASIGGKWVGAQVHHVVGGDRGWDPSSGVASWSSGKIFRVGDKLWFAYSAAQESVAELSSREEYESCDVSNPIRMYTDGLERIPLDGEGTRYFASSKPESCKNGLKLHVEVQPPSKAEIQAVATSETSALVMAAPPTIPSAAAHLRGVSSLFLMAVLMLFYHVGL